jgi:hypothetical protein
MATTKRKQSKQTAAQKRVANARKPAARPVARPVAEPDEIPVDDDDETSLSGQVDDAVVDIEAQVKSFCRGAVSLEVRRLKRTSTKRMEYTPLVWEWDPSTFTHIELGRVFGGGNFLVVVRRPNGQLDQFGVRLEGPPREPDPGSTLSQRHTGMPAGLRLVETDKSGWIAIIGQTPEEAYRSIRDQVYTTGLREDNHKLTAALCGVLEKFFMRSDPSAQLVTMLDMQRAQLEEESKEKKSIEKRLVELKADIAKAKSDGDDKTNWKDVLSALVSEGGIVDTIGTKLMQARKFLAEEEAAKLAAGAAGAAGTAT